MNAARASVWVVTIAAATLVGCASVPREAGFPDVERIVSEPHYASSALGPREPSDTAVAEAVRGLFQKESADEALQISLLNNRSLLTYEDLMVAQADLVAAASE